LFGIIDETPAYPTALKIRPQFASCPYKAVFTNDEVETVDAICFASANVFAPYSKKMQKKEISLKKDFICGINHNK